MVSCCGVVYARLASNVGKIVDKMQSTYDEMTNMQAALIAGEVSERWDTSCML